MSSDCTLIVRRHDFDLVWDILGLQHVQTDTGFAVLFGHDGPVDDFAVTEWDPDDREKLAKLTAPVHVLENYAKRLRAERPKLEREDSWLELVALRRMIEAIDQVLSRAGGPT